MADRKLVEPADLYRIPTWILARPFYALAPISLLFRFATARGTVLSVLPRQRRHVGQRIREVYPNASSSECRRLVRQHLQFRERERLTNLWPCMRGFRGVQKITIEGRHHLDETLRAGHGAIILTAHFGYARLLKPILVSHGYRALLIGSPSGVRIQGFPRLTRVGRLVRKGILRLPWPEAEDESWTRAAGYDLRAQLNIRPHLEALARNEILVSLPEGRGAQAMHRVSMMGIDVLMAPNVLSMARHTGAAVLPAFVGDDPASGDPMGVRLVIDPPLTLPSNGGGGLPEAPDLQSLANIFESWIRASPRLWLAWSGPPLAWWGGSSRPATR